MCKSATGGSGPLTDLNSTLSDEEAASNPGDYYYWYQRGETLANLGHYLDALHCFERALVVCPDDVNALVFQGVVLIHLERYEAALQCLDRSLQLHPHHTEALVFRGAALNHLGRYSECYASYEKALGDRSSQSSGLRRTVIRWIMGLQHRLHRLLPHT